MTSRESAIRRFLPSREGFHYNTGHFGAGNTVARRVIGPASLRTAVKRPIHEIYRLADPRAGVRAAAGARTFQYANRYAEFPRWLRVVRPADPHRPGVLCGRLAGRAGVGG